MRNLRGRAALRGKPLDENCCIAKISTHEYGIGDDRKYCYGICDEFPDELAEKCKICGAYCMNATPLEERKEVEK